ncbi:hypothetical protein TrCOL_g12498 [Triparma columacea]|uniref:Cyclic nucleotide-binding domain-containing protein n=1 Tax=Triparma columacea TaxID=722753 RepID=A0A9W7GN11_9STRA|nr:hypothetical protein TrCOL_g12498 [Triparma columacea]
MNESLSNMCGHFSFILLGTSYITSDIFHLRILAMSGISLSILFQYYRPLPLFIPIRWNALFLITNAGMIAALLSERNEANKMSDNERELYDREFKQMGFTPVEYYRLVRAGRRRQVKQGSYLCEESQVQKNMYFLLSGSIEVSIDSTNNPTAEVSPSGSQQITRRRSRVASISPNSFIGEMTFLTYLQESRRSTSASTTCIANEDSEVLEWDFEELATALETEKNRGVKNALQAKLSNDLRKKLSAMTSTGA